jgi:hypothetical protein
MANAGAGAVVGTDLFHSRHWTDRFDPALVAMAAVIGFAVPVVLFLWTIAANSVNVIVQDQLVDVPLINASYAHAFPWAQLWAPYHEDRTFFPNLVVLALAHTVHFNVQVEEYLGALLLIGAVAVIILTHRRRSPDTLWLYYCPVAILILSVVQYDTMLLGGVSWYLVLLMLASALFFLDRGPPQPWWTAGAVLCAVVGSFSSSAGLLIWPSALVLLALRRRSWRSIVTWCVCAVVTFVVYNIGFQPDTSAAPHWGWVLDHPVPAAKFFVMLIGDTIGQVILLEGSGGALVFGLSTLAIAIVALIVYGRRRDNSTGAPVGLALVTFGLLFAMTATLGRGIYGGWVAAASRYTTYDLLILTGAYLAFLVPPGGSEAVAPSRAPLRKQPTFLVVTLTRGFLLLLIAIQAFLGFENGGVGAADTHVYQEHARVVSKNIDHYSDSTVRWAIEPVFSASHIRHQVQTARRLHLAEFASSRG